MGAFGVDEPFEDRASRTPGKPRSTLRQPEGCCRFEMRFQAAIKSSVRRRVERQVFAC